MLGIRPRAARPFAVELAVFARLVALVFALLIGAVGGCDLHRISKLEEGVATESDVRSQFGEPAAVFSEADGGRTLEYPRQPAGQANYFITIGADGKMSALRQVLKQASFDRIQHGMDKVAVRRVLGRPAKTQYYPLKQEEIWDWRYREDEQNRVFSVTFDNDGRVMQSGSAIEDRGPQGGGS